MKNVLVIGGGRGQVPVMNLCHQYGCNVICVTPNGNYPGIKIADNVFFEDVKNYKSILEFAKKNNIEAVVTEQLDAGVYTVAYIAENLGLKGISCEVAKKFTNKFIMRNEAEKAGINVPKCLKINSLDKIEENLKSKNLKFPLIMKPVDGAASQGVQKVNSVEDICSYFDNTLSYSNSKEVIIEEFINGKEYVVEAYTKDFNVKNLIVGHRDYFNIDGTFIPCATVFVDANSANDNIELMLKETNEKLIKAFGLPFGITHAEYLYNEEENKIYLVEIAARGGGVFISSDLIPTACGVDANELLVKEVLGISDNSDINLCKGSSAYFCYLTPEGVVSKLDNIDKVENIEGVHKAFFDNIELGMHTLSIKDKSSRKGPILVKGRTKEDCYNIIDKVKKILDIQVSTSSEIKNIIWS